ncbi:MAG: hypothetical protein A3K10_03785 [Bacteroidetes bacterium RIFCSPLOWO2_12_FULL_31_6]|nr:MAG: hypothetical protein A3K10_03785 [Bacteroidetes bacterium RIFCSPLOWO2_12_FULL_31_6]
MRTYGFFIVLTFLLFIDWYVWTSFRHEISKIGRPLWQWIVSILYWLPAISVCVIAISTLVLVNNGNGRPNNVYLNYTFGIILVTYVSKLLPFIFIVVTDLLRLCEFAIQYIIPDSIAETKQFSSIGRNQFIKNIGWLSGGILFSSLVTGILKWVYDFQIRKDKLQLVKLPKSFEGLKIVQISDLHLGSWLSDKPLRRAIEMINKLNPDLIFFTGDLVNNRTDEAYPFEDALRLLKSKYGIFSTLGNHDYGDYIEWPSKEAKRKNFQDIVDFHKKIGWRILMNEHEAIEINGEKICVIGVENWGASLSFPKHGKIDEAIKNTEKYPIKLLLSHDPSHWDQMISKQYSDIDITFSGHTHGMQMGIEIPWLKWSPVEYVYPHWAGLYTNIDLVEKQQYLYVNRGLGHIGYPGRMGIFPEITLIELTT